MKRFKVYWRVRPDLAKSIGATYVTTVTYPPWDADTKRPDKWEPGTTDILDLDQNLLATFYHRKPAELVSEEDCDRDLNAFADGINVLEVYRRLREEFHAVTRLGFIDIEVQDEDVQGITEMIKRDYDSKILLVEVARDLEAPVIPDSGKNLSGAPSGN